MFGHVVVQARARARGQTDKFLINIPPTTREQNKVNFCKSVSKLSAAVAGPPLPRAADATKARLLAVA